MVRHRVLIPVCVGSIPTSVAKLCGLVQRMNTYRIAIANVLEEGRFDSDSPLQIILPVAQWLERLPVKQNVESSILSG